MNSFVSNKGGLTSSQNMDDSSRKENTAEISLQDLQLQKQDNINIMSDYKALQEDYNKLRTNSNRNEIRMNQLKETVQHLTTELENQEKDFHQSETVLNDQIQKQEDIINDLELKAQIIIKKVHRKTVESSNHPDLSHFSRYTAHNLQSQLLNLEDPNHSQLQLDNDSTIMRLKNNDFLLDDLQENLSEFGN